MLIVEEYIPEYRQGFFEGLEAALGSESIRLGVAVGSPRDAVNARRDEAVDSQRVHRVHTRSVSLFGRHLAYRSVGALAGGARLVVVDQALRHLENYVLLSRQRRGPAVGLWGHGARRAKRASSLERLVERRATRSAHWFFAYTPSGVEAVAASGFPRDRITLVQNTLDVRRLAHLRDAVSEAEQLDLRAELGLPPRHVCLFIGALDAAKRLGFLLSAGSLLARRLPEFTLLIAGDGPERRVVEESLAARPWLRYVGRASDEQKARLGAVSDVLLMPGAVGLVAVDSFALRTPIVTTRWPYHGPEIDYLVDGVNARITLDREAEFAQTVEELLTSTSQLAELKSACAKASSHYSLENMVANFAGGVIAALSAPRR